MKVLIVSQHIKNQTKPHKTLITIVEISNCMMAVMPRYSVVSVWMRHRAFICVYITTYSSHNTISLHPFFPSRSLALSFPLAFDCTINTYLWFKQQQQEITKFGTFLVSWEIFRSSLKQPITTELQFIIHTMIFFYSSLVDENEALKMMCLCVMTDEIERENNNE